MKELQTLVDEAKPESPVIDEDAFPGTPADASSAGATFFWTSSTSASVDSAAWFINFGSGQATDATLVDGDIVDLDNLVRCVH